MNKAQSILKLAQKFNNSSDMMFDLYGIRSKEIFDAIVIAPSWIPEKILGNYDAKITCLTIHSYFRSYMVEFDGLKIAWIQCASSASNLIDTALTLANSSTDKIIFVGAVGALVKDIKLGDIVTPSESYSYEGGSVYLSGDINSPKFGNTVKPHNMEFINVVIEKASQQGITMSKKKVFCTDSIICEYSFLDEILQTGAELIEMETAAFYKCMEMMNKDGIALLCVSDNSATGISLVARSEEEKEYYDFSKNKGIPELIKIACTINR